MTTMFRTHFTFRVDTWTPHAKALSSTSLASRTTRLHSLPTARCANVGPARPSPGAAGQTRVVSMAGIRLGSGESARAFKGIICDDISEIAVGTLITERPPQSGRVEARIGLRMMPTFPRPSLSFRTAGFPRYGWHVGQHLPAHGRLKPAPGIHRLMFGLCLPLAHIEATSVIPHCVG